MEGALQLNKYETDPYFLQLFQSNTTVCLIISLFYKSFKHICETEIVLKIFAADFQAAKTLSCSVFNSQILQYTVINIVGHWKYGPV